MICPHCQQDIEERLVRSHVAREMGKKGGVASGNKPRTEAQKQASNRNLKKANKRQVG